MLRRLLPISVLALAALSGFDMVAVPADATTAPAACLQTNIKVSLVAPTSDSSAAVIARVVIVNHGSRCTLPQTRVKVQAMTHKRVPVGPPSGTEQLRYATIVLERGAVAEATVSITPTSDVSNCVTKPALTLKLFGYERGWPNLFLPLSRPTQICTGVVTNLTGSSPQLTR